MANDAASVEEKVHFTFILLFAIMLADFE